MTQLASLKQRGSSPPRAQTPISPCAPPPPPPAATLPSTCVSSTISPTCTTSWWSTAQVGGAKQQGGRACAAGGGSLGTGGGGRGRGCRVSLWDAGEAGCPSNPPTHPPTRRYGTQRATACATTPVSRRWCWRRTTATWRCSSTSTAAAAARSTPLARCSGRREGAGPGRWPAARPPGSPGCWRIGWDPQGHLPEAPRALHCRGPQLHRRSRPPAPLPPTPLAPQTPPPQVTSYSLALREIDTVQDEEEYVPNALEVVLRKVGGAEHGGRSSRGGLPASFEQARADAHRLIPPHPTPPQGHLDMLEEPLIATLLRHKWGAFARTQVRRAPGSPLWLLWRCVQLHPGPNFGECWGHT
jgi:hypothetical protein